MDGGTFALPIPNSKQELYDKHKGEAFYFGIRPEHIYDRSFLKDYDPRNVIKTRVELIEPVGSFVILQIALGDSVIVAQVDPHTQAEVGKEIELVVDMEKLHLFSTTSPHPAM